MSSWKRRSRIFAAGDVRHNSARQAITVLEMALLPPYRRRDSCHSERGDRFYESCFTRRHRGNGKSWRAKGGEQRLCEELPFASGLALIATPAVTKQVESRLERKKLEESVDREKLVELAQQVEGKESISRLAWGRRAFVRLHHCCRRSRRIKPGYRFCH